MPSSHAGQSFLAGAVCSAALIYLYQRVQVCDTRRGRKTEYHPPSAPSDKLMDSCALDQRMIRKAEGAILNRTSRLIIVVERCTNDHNYSAILRTAEALGVQHVYIIAPRCIKSTLTSNGDEGDEINEVELKRSSGQTVKRATESEKQDRAMHHLYARKATEWLTVTDFEDTKSCIDALRKDRYQIWATDLGQVATCLTEEELSIHASSHGGKLIPDKVAIVFGTEAVGCTNEMLNAADMRVYLPLRGFADSLNLSVATALVVHQMFVLDPTLIGGMSEKERTELRQAWYSKLASQRLLSSRDKKHRSKLVTYLRGVEELERKMLAGEPMQQQVLEKLEKKAAKQAELDQIENKLAADSRLAVKDLVENPPAPITDMRRADEHRTCFVGKNTKATHGDAWADMPATANLPVTHNATASFFRDRVATKNP
mmetsp:Transcript_24321/g.50935  ORF Transcript_24321/g.50935 Transcript_24321/m.50935 type:complete len:429 (-) Transcript_24321:51-1337(-)